jgi:hypothetical protein
MFILTFTLGVGVLCVSRSHRLGLKKRNNEEKTLTSRSWAICVNIRRQISRASTSYQSQDASRIVVGPKRHKHSRPITSEGKSFRPG